MASAPAAAYPPRTVLLPLDFSPPSSAALRWAARRLRLGATSADVLLLLHVLPPRSSGPARELWYSYGLSATEQARVDMEPGEYDPESRDEEEQVRAAMRTVFVEGVLREEGCAGFAKAVEEGRAKVEVVLARGEEGHVVAQLAKDKGVEQIVVGRTSLKGFRAFTHTSTSQAIIKLAPCPVTIVPEGVSP
ncbi:hypothetical protein DFJ74DRAFT_713093 [Hyaloraphidium curvatum]|nr:hypothetical protein DFJ74DRAFT_713093 [Hyaloraphidium curvatum]